MITPHKQGGGSTRGPALTYMVALGGVVEHVVVYVAVVLWFCPVWFPHILIFAFSF